MINILNAVENFIAFAIEKTLLDARDITYARNCIFDILKLEVSNELGHSYAVTDPQSQVFDVLTDYAIRSGLIKEYERIHFETRLFSAVTPLPSVFIDKFLSIKERFGITAATDWMFEFAKNTNYVRMVDINKNMLWEHCGRFGKLEVTVNLSKPEKSPEQVALEATRKKSGYPACVLCRENEGFSGHISHPARQTLRILPIKLINEPWGFQYSPYQYYKEHCIALSLEHRPMKVDNACLARLLDFVTQFPNYFMGSNAALPLVGGSILSHDHYQGGAKVLPIFKSKNRKTYSLNKFVDAKVSIVDWYNSVVRIESTNRNAALSAATHVLNAWSAYSDSSINLIALTNNVPHNAVTPIARLENGIFTIDMILRNNRTDTEHPYGIFHPEERLHHIKKESIGIIEVSGIFILPGRLKAELETKRLTKEVISGVCEEILEATAIFKNTPVGNTAFEKFMDTL